MRDVTKALYDDFKLKDLGYDFMGYVIERKQDLSFHHLIIPRRLSKQNGIGEGYCYWNGALLVQDTSHEYLHLIEAKDLGAFNAITSEVIDIKAKGFLDKENLVNIRQILLEFEEQHKNERSKKGKMLIKREYITKRIEL